VAYDEDLANRVRELVADAAAFEMRGSAMQGWLRVDPEGLHTKRQLTRWVERVSYARSLPAKA
jgi:hypothetical protein